MTDEFKLMLAPIEDMTGNAFRTICHKYGADVTFTELTRVEGLARKNKATWSRLAFHDDTPTVIQLLGAKEMHFKKFLSMFKPSPGFLGFNLNLGCPSPHVINLGQGCAMMRRIAKTKKIVDIFKEHGYPISIKMRLGLNEIDKKNKIYMHMLNAVDADYFIVHGRTGNQTYADFSDFSCYEEMVSTGRKIIANGDIKTKQKIDMLQKIGVKGAMIGRAAIANPLIFNELKGISSPTKESVLEEYVSLSKKYEEPFKFQRNILKHSGIDPTKMDLREN